MLCHWLFYWLRKKGFFCFLGGFWGFFFGGFLWCSSLGSLEALLQLSCVCAKSGHLPVSPMSSVTRSPSWTTWNVNMWWSIRVWTVRRPGAGASHGFQSGVGNSSPKMSLDCSMNLWSMNTSPNTLVMGYARQYSTYYFENTEYRFRERYRNLREMCSWARRINWAEEKKLWMKTWPFIILY